MIAGPQEQDFAERHMSERSIAKVLSRSFLSAHLLTGNITQAEKAVIDAIQIWDPNKDDEQQLFQITLRAAVQMQAILSPSVAHEEYITDPRIPVELRRVLELAPVLRRSFVLRVLVDLPSQVCARTLHLSVSLIDKYSCDAIKSLAAINKESLSRQSSQQARTGTI
jgi:hypothetical protein